MWKINKKKIKYLITSRPRAQLLAANMVLCSPALLWMETLSRTLLSAAEAKGEALLDIHARSLPDQCGKVYHPVDNDIVKLCYVIYILQSVFGW